MPGSFSKDNRPARPGSYFNWKGVVRESIPPSPGGIVAVGFTHDWGPAEQVVEINGYSDFHAKYGPTLTTEGEAAVRQAFEGEDFRDRRGAQQVLGFRMVGAAAAKATKTLQNTTPATALTLTARYEGTYGNNLRFTTQDYATDATKNELIVYINATEVERFRYTDTDINALAADINANSDWVTAVANVSAVALAPVVSQAATGGNDGSVLLAADYTAFMAALDSWQFGYATFANLTDSSIQAALKTWTLDSNVNGRRFFLVLGGSSDETISTATTRATAMNDPDIISGAMAHITHPVLGNLSSAQWAPRLAGILAQRGEAKGTTFARMNGVTLVSGASSSDIVKAFDAGLIVLSRGIGRDAPVRIEKGLTTWTTTTDPDRPYKIFRSPKYVQTMHGIQSELQQWSDTEIIGEGLQVNDRTRDTVLQHALDVLRSRSELGIIRDPTAEIDQEPPPNDDDEFIAVRLGGKFGRSAEQVFWTAYMA